MSVIQPEESGNLERPGTAEEKAEAEFARNLLFQIDNLLHARLNSLLVAQTIFFLCVATAWKSRALVLICSLLGILTAVIFLLTICRLNKRVHWWIAALRRYWRIYRVSLALLPIDTPEENLKPAGANYRTSGWYFTWGLGGAFLVGWVAIAFIRLTEHCTKG